MCIVKTNQKLLHESLHDTPRNWSKDSAGVIIDISNEVAEIIKCLGHDIKQVANMVSIHTDETPMANQLRYVPTAFMLVSRLSQVTENLGFEAIVTRAIEFCRDYLKSIVLS